MTAQAELNPYPRYRASGVAWLGDVPAHWDVRRLGTLVKVINGATPSTNVPGYWDGYILWVTPDDLGKLTSRYVTSSERSISDAGYESCGTTLAPYGSIVISTRAPIGHLGILSSEGCVNQGCRILAPSLDVQSEFLYFALLTSRTDLASLGQGSTFTELSRSRLTGFRIPLPPLDEQAAIVRYLDYADGRIRRYVGAKGRLIALLEEERQAVVNQAVTRGLDAEVALKPSGVEWLGDVPAHWEVSQLGRIGTFSKGSGGTKDDEVPAGIPCVRYGDLYTTHKYFISQARSYISPARASSYTEIKRGDVLFPTSGETIEEIGKSAVNLMGDQVLCGGDLIIFRPTIPMEPKFAGYALDCSESQTQKSLMGRGITIMHIYSRQLKYLWLPLPPLAEQAAIVEYLDRATAGIDAAMARARRQMELVEEYRVRLIADVVTGKVDVRDGAAGLPGDCP